jgi:hypothetical protein
LPAVWSITWEAWANSFSVAWRPEWSVSMCWAGIYIYICMLYIYLYIELYGQIDFFGPFTFFPFFLVAVFPTHGLPLCMLLFFVFVFSYSA